MGSFVFQRHLPLFTAGEHLFRELLAYIFSLLYLLFSTFLLRLALDRTAFSSL